MKENTKQILESYVAKAHKLSDFHFDEHVKQKGLNFSGMMNEDNEWVFDFGTPDVKELDAFVLTLRMFIQQNESISFQNTHSILSDHDISEQLREGIKLARQAYFAYINSYSDYKVELFEGHPTRGQMLETVLYGDLAHGNDPETVKRFRTWSRDEIRANLLKQEFTAILLQILVFIKHLADLSEKELNSAS